MLTVCNFHYIRKSFESKYPSIFGVTPGDFKNQLELLKKRGVFISQRDLISDSESILGSHKNFILVTFDDGLKEQYELAMPILDKLKVPAVFFINSGVYEFNKVSLVHKIHTLRAKVDPKQFLCYILEKSNIHFSTSDKTEAKKVYRWDDDISAETKYLLNFKMGFVDLNKIIEPAFNDFVGIEENLMLDDFYMSLQQIKELGERGFIGSHSHTHVPLGLLTADEIKLELEISKEYLGKLTNSEIELVAYPYGTSDAATPEVSRIAKSVGYKLGFTTKPGDNRGDTNDLLLLNRFDCNDLEGGKNYK